MAVRVSDAQILTATAESIREHGVHGATTREIARRAGVNEVTLFRRFGDKTQLVRAAVHQAIRNPGAGEFEPTGDVRADLMVVVHHYAAVLDPRSGIALVMLGETARHPELADLLAEPIAVLGRVGDLIRFHQRAGALLDEPVGDALAALVGPLLFTALSRTVGRSGGIDRTEPGSHERLVESFLRGHGVAPAGGGSSPQAVPVIAESPNNSPAPSAAP